MAAADRDGRTGSAGRLPRLFLAVAIGVALGGAAVAPTARAQSADAEGFASDHTGDADKGRLLFGQCSSCHALGPKAANRTGPHLNELLGRKAGAVDGFAYSLPLTALGLRGLSWTEEALDIYLRRPEDLIDGTVMPHVGMPSAQERADLIAFLARETQAARSGGRAAEVVGGAPEGGAAH